MVASPRLKWFGLALLGAVQFMVVLDIAIVNVALPSIEVDLGFSRENLQWVISAYALFFGGFLLLGGRAADQDAELPHFRAAFHRPIMRPSGSVKSDSQPMPGTSCSSTWILPPAATIFLRYGARSSTRM